MPTCFSRVGMEVPTVGGDCLCGEFVRFDLAHRRLEHFMVCPVVDERLAHMPPPVDIDEDAVKAGIDALNKD